MESKMPPFPQEPAPGSPEAVAQAAGTLRRGTPADAQPGEVYISPEAMPLLRSLYGPEAAAGAAETLRGWGDFYQDAAIAELAAERDRLRAELEQSRADHADTLAKWRAVVEDDVLHREQRDALAGALLAYLFQQTGWTTLEHKAASGLTGRCIEALQKAGR